MASLEILKNVLQIFDRVEQSVLLWEGKSLVSKDEVSPKVFIAFHVYFLWVKSEWNEAKQRGMHLNE